MIIILYFRTVNYFKNIYFILFYKTYDSSTRITPIIRIIFKPPNTVSHFYFITYYRAVNLSLSAFFLQYYKAKLVENTV